MTNLRDVIAEATVEHGDESLWSDGGTNWQLDLFVESLDEYGWPDADESVEWYTYDGRTIWQHIDDGAGRRSSYLRLVAMTGSDLRALRSQLGYSLTAMARATGITVPTLCRYQSGALAIPRWFELSVRRLAPRTR